MLHHLTYYSSQNIVPPRFIQDVSAPDLKKGYRLNYVNLCESLELLPSYEQILIIIMDLWIRQF